MTKEEAHKCLHEVDFALLIKANQESIIAQNKNTEAQKEVLALLNGKEGLIADSVVQKASIKRIWKVLGVLFAFMLLILRLGIMT